MEYWLLMDADNPYRLAYCGGCDQDPKLPYMTENREEAIRYADYKSADQAASAISDKRDRGFIPVPRGESKR